ncbi:MAG: phosphoglucomutase/phosphomannomutase family protein [Acidobacteria bacterium]|nr:phosphoglucomutase/phosphomannomutase family protein [Acidobacteriota bacterium]MBV9476712.1 phosphoglucomutase/phosphomannomutase family protein [Acidobacteriota bacterium]
MSGGISFGTDGWRAVIAETFTFDNVRRVADAIAVAARGLKPPDDIDANALLVGFDRRFLSREFAGVVAEALRAAGYRVLLSDRPTPSQTISFTAKHRKVLGGVVVTASHNPATYNGLKFKAWYGGSALPETYAAISASVGQRDARDGGTIEETNILDDYLDALRAQLDLALLKNARLAILHDPIHGVAASLPSKILGLDYTGAHRILERDARPIETTIVDGIRGEVNPGFGGVNPEPIPENVNAARNVMLANDYDLAICNDGDADRLGILDQRGNFVSPHKVISLLALYLVREKKRAGELVKTFSTTRLIEKVARSLGATLHETPIGFKYVADLMLTRDVLIGGEESGGIGIGAFLPERDGVLSGLLVAEAVAYYGLPLSDLIERMEKEFGALHYDRRDVHRPMEQCARLIERVRAGALDGAFGVAFARLEETDGVKMNFADGSWLLFRKSGTEPIIRLYCESPDPELVQSMLATAMRELDRG